MKTWRIPVVWQNTGIITVEADTLEEAMEIARDDDEVIPVPDNFDYVPGSWMVDGAEAPDEIRLWYNDGQSDDSD